MTDFSDNGALAPIGSAFGASSTAREIVAGHDLSGRRAVVTGGASGVGLETARALAEAGCEVMLAVRDKAAGEAAAAEIGRTAKGAVSVGAIDLANLSSVAAFGRAWGDAPLDLLVNNAAVMGLPLSHTIDGLETHVGVNHFGHFLLTLMMLRPLMNAAEDGLQSRVVTLSSVTHQAHPFDFDDPHFRRRPYDKLAAYAQSKTAAVHMAVGLDDRFADLGIAAFAVNPGGMVSRLWDKMAPEELIALGWLDKAGKPLPQYKTAEQGAATVTWGCVGPELENLGGFYLENCAQAVAWSAETMGRGVADHAMDLDRADRFWALSEETTGAGL